MKLYSAATILALVSLTEAEKTRNLKSKSSKSTKSWSYPKTKSCKGGSTSSSTAADTGYASLKAGSLIDTGDNICAGSKVELPNIPCEIQEIIDEIEMKNVNPGFALGTAEQAGGNVTAGYIGGLDVTSEPILRPYSEEGMCPVNVHWHAGTEHLSQGEYDYDGKGPGVLVEIEDDYRRKLAMEGKEIRQGLRCHHYDETDEKYTKEYDWKYCVDMHVGETYEVHWPHSNMGDCGTSNQYQYPFYDGVFCNFNNDKQVDQERNFKGDLSKAKIGVQAQVFVIVNDEDYYYGRWYLVASPYAH